MQISRGVRSVARLRVFISSTYYDLKYVREDVARFVEEQGYEPVLFERGEVPYGRKEAPQEYCYKEIQLSDILVSIVGGRYGSQSSTPGYSVTQKELRKALEAGKQVYIFVEKSVRAEYETYKVNKDNDKMKYRFVDDRQVYEFIDELYALPRNNAIFPFESAQDIVATLREQWAGLFQRLLQEETERLEVDALIELRDSVTTLKQLVTVISKQAKSVGPAVESIVQVSHPAFNRIKHLLSVPYRVFFTTLDELNVFLKARGYNEVELENRDDPHILEWVKMRDSTQHLLKVDSDLFDEQWALKPVTDSEEWDNTAISHEVSDVAPLEIITPASPFRS